jgi:hypothetical protein
METQFNLTFNETQKFNQRWLWILLVISGLSVIGIFGFGFYKQIILGQSFGNNPMPDICLIVVFISSVIVFSSIFLFFLFAKLTTEIDKIGIRFKFFPFHKKYKEIMWDMVDNYEVKKYSPIGDFGGWGIRYGLNKKAYTTSGDIALQLKLKSGKRIIIGTQKEKELTDYLKSI